MGCRTTPVPLSSAGRGVSALWNRPAGPFSPGKRAQQEPDARHALALRCRSRAAPGPDHRSYPRHPASAGQSEAGPDGSSGVGAGFPFCSCERQFRGRRGQRVRSAAEGRATSVSCRGHCKDVEARKTRMASPVTFSRWLASPLCAVDFRRTYAIPACVDHED